MGSVADKFLRFLKDDYIVGAESATDVPKIYIDPGLVKAHERFGPHSVAEKARFISAMLDEQFTGISTMMNIDALRTLYDDSLRLGPFANKPFDNSSLCIINKPLSGSLDRKNILKFFNIEGAYEAAHLREIPGSSRIWKEIIGKHEGEHCNQPPYYSNDPYADLRELEGEIKSDRILLADLRAAGHHDVARFFTDIRILRIGSSETSGSHATGAFVEEGVTSMPTPEYLEAVRLLKNDLVAGVALHLCLTEDAAGNLQKQNPRAFAQALKEAAEAGKIPADRNMSEDEFKKALAKKMGVSVEEMEKLKANDLPRFTKAYQALEAETGFITRSEYNPYREGLIRSYIEATDRMFHAQTPPPPQLKAEEPYERSEGIKPDDSPEALKAEADTQVMDSIYGVLSKRLGKTEDELRIMLANDLKGFIQALKEACDDPTTSFQTSRAMTGKEMDEHINKMMGLPPDASLSKAQFYMFGIIHDRLEEARAFKVSRDNPNIRPLALLVLQEYQTMDMNKKPDADSKNQSPASSASPAAASAAMVSGNELERMAGMLARPASTPLTASPAPEAPKPEFATPLIKPHPCNHAHHKTGGMGMD